MANWTASSIPSQAGRAAVITGTGGLGFEGGLALARAGGEVIIAGRDAQKGADAVKRIRTDVPSANVRFEPVDLASLKSVAEFAARLRSQRDSLDLLINNAGVMTPPERRETSDGFELQFGTNYLGHFALTAGLLPLLRNGNRARVVTLSSIAANNATIDFGDLAARNRYSPFPVYGQSKLACLIFAFELQRRSVAGGWGIASLAAHPGLSRTDLIVNGAGWNSSAGRLRRFLPFLFQPAWQGALPPLFAATSPEATPGAYYGPDKMGETQGYPALSKVPPRAADMEVAQRLWRVSEELAGVAFHGDRSREGLTP
jgi:NAD(P)-dependent dehydrogenase (short-subunit alcohol dehydrogenase family)